MLKNIGWMTVSTLLRLGAGFVLFIILARKLGPENFGQLAYWLAFSSLLALLVNYGFGLQLLREIGRDPNSAARVYSATLAAKLVLSVLIIAVGLVIGLQESVPTAIFWSLLVMALAESFAEHINFVLRALGHFDKEARFALFTSAVNFFGVLLPLLVFGTITAVAVGFLLSRCATLLLGWRLALPFLPVIQKPNDWSLADVWKTLRDGFPYAADMAVSTLNSTLDVLLLGHMSNNRAVGVYQAGLKLMQGGITLAPIISNVYLPKIAATSLDKKITANLIASLNGKMIAIGAVGLIVFSLGKVDIVHWVYGDKYSELVDVFPWFGLTLFLRYLAAGYGVSFSALGFQQVRVLSNFISLIVLVCAAIYFIPMCGAKGVLLALSMSSVVLIFSYKVIAIINSIPIKIKYVPLVFSAIAMVLFVSSVLNQ